MFATIRAVASQQCITGYKTEIYGRENVCLRCGRLISRPFGAHRVCTFRRAVSVVEVLWTEFPEALIRGRSCIGTFDIADNFSVIVHDADYRTSWKDWESFVESLTEKIVEKDDTIPELPAKDLV